MPTWPPPACPSRWRLDDSFTLEEGGAIEIKGKGEMHPWFLNNRNGRMDSIQPFPEPKVSFGANDEPYLERSPP